MGGCAGNIPQHESGSAIPAITPKPQRPRPTILRSTRLVGSSQILWAYLLPIVAIHILALLAFVPGLFSWTGLIVMLAGVHLFGNMGINLGYHRLLSHRSFWVPKWLEYCFSIAALCCMQDTPIRWVATHRLHHTCSDGPGDPHSPHSPRHAFLWSHIGWLFRRSPALHDIGVYQKYARDLWADPFYMFLEKRPTWAGWIYIGHALLFFLVGVAAGYWLWSDGRVALQFGASLLVWGVFVRTVAVWHISWSVNSLTHLFGYRNYATDEHSRNNWLVALVSSGEGWHNNHHWDPSSASVQHRWWELDVTYYTICLLARLGLAREVISPRHVRREAS